jgi:DNA-binding CsgD family transcriptional regulator
MARVDPRDPGAAPLVGRDAELSALLAALERAGAGRPGAVLLTGDAGVGKTRLLGTAADLARERGARVLVGHCLDLGDVGVPFLPVAEVLSGLVAAADDPARAALVARPVLARLSPAVGALLGGDAAAATGTADRLALFEAVEGLLAELAGDDGSPVVLVLEDLHWADASTRDLLRFLLARLRVGRLLVLASVRAEDLHRRHPLRPRLAELGRLGSVRRLEVGPLRPEALVEHLRHLDAAGDGPGRSEAQLAQVAARSEGNPYYAEELLVSGTAAGAGVPGAVSDVLLGRTLALDAAARRAVAAAAVGGAVVSDRLLRAVLAGELPGGAAAVDAALEEAVGAAVLVPRADGYGFRHALLQEAVLDDLLPGERTALHAAHARLLAQAAAAGAPLAPAAELARHATASHDAPTALSASAEAAAEALDRLAPGEALRHVEQALALLPVVPGVDEAAVSAPLAAALGSPPLLSAVAAELAARAGELGRAVEHARRAVPLADGPLQAVEARTRAALHLLAADVDGSLTAQASDLLDEAEQLAGALAGPVPDAAADALRARVLVQRGRVALARDELAAAGEAATRALPLARAAGDAAAEAEARATLAVVHDVAGRDAEVTEHLARALELAAAAGDPLAASRASYLLGMHHWGAGRVPEALARFERVSAELAAHGLAWSRYGISAVWMTSVARFAAGDLAGAAAAAEHGASGPDPVHRTLTRAAGLAPAAALGEEGVAERAAELLPAVASDPLATLLVLGARAEALAWRGLPLEAAAAAADAVAVAESVDLEEALSGIWLSAVGVAALADAGLRGGADPAAGEALARRGRTLSQRPPGRGGPLGPEGRAWLARLDAELARLTAPGAAAAVAAWRAALEAFGYGHRYELARCRWRLAEALLATGGSDAREEARALLATALEEAGQMAAAPLAAGVRDLARRARLRLDGGPGGPGGPGAVVDSPLTDREAEVLALVAQGLTNRRTGERLFISEKTVSVHLSNAMAKLGASGRAEAVAVATRRGLLPPPGGETPAPG